MDFGYGKYYLDELLLLTQMLYNWIGRQRSFT